MWDKSDILILQQSPLFSHFTSLAEIEAALHLLKANRKAFQKDECVWRAGEKVREIGVVVFGAVHIKQTDWWGNQNILNEIKARDIFGEAFATINDMPLSSDVISATETVIIFLNVRELLESDDCDNMLSLRFIKNLYKISSSRNRYLTKKLRYLSCRTTRDKLLSYFSEQARVKKSPSFDIPFDRQQLADYLSVERSAMSAELGRMKKDGLLDFKKNHFTLLKE